MLAETIQSILGYYTNLLIIQYNNQPKARATIKLLMGELFASGVFLDIQNAYNLETAVGVQLDVLGKYEGIDRYYRAFDLINFFAFTDYTDVDPDAQPKFGFTDYADFSNFDYNGTLTYDSIISTNNRLLDEDFRTMIKLKILQNNLNHSYQSIDAGIYRFFGDAIRPESFGGMHLFYFINRPLTVLMQAALIKKVLPRPMGVGISIITGITGEMFGLTSYDDITAGFESPFAYGFSDYTDYDSLSGQVLVYNQITTG